MLLKPLGHLSRICFFAGININIQQGAKGTASAAGPQYFADVLMGSRYAFFLFLMSSPRKRRSDVSGSWNVPSITIVAAIQDSRFRGGPMYRNDIVCGDDVEVVEDDVVRG